MSGIAGTTIAIAISEQLLQLCRRWRIQATITVVIPTACRSTMCEGKQG